MKLKKKDKQVLEVLGDRFISSFCIAHMLNVSEFKVEEHLRDMRKRGLVESKQDAVADWRVLWRSIASK